MEKDERIVKIRKDKVEAEIARRDLESFALALEPNIEMTRFHRTYYDILTRFARGEIRRLVVSVPPQHGKSHGASKLLPAYLLGLDPDLKICIGSYSFALARKFGIAVQRLIESKGYQQIFPATKLKGMAGGERSNSARTAEEFEIVGREGGLRLVGREGSLTGNRVDVMIIDDMYKDAMEANSEQVRSNAWEWYCAVVRTRMHNNSCELIVSTRWHKDDLIGRLVATQADELMVVNFEAIKTGVPTRIDPRHAGEPLWGERHSLELLEKRRGLDCLMFESLYQGNPQSDEGRLYGSFATYDRISEPVARRSAYVDSADNGRDYLCAIIYAMGEQSGRIYVLDIVYTNEPMERTEAMVADMLQRHDVCSALFEGNNGGRGFARAVGRRVRCRIETFHQRANKEARILSNASQVMRSIVMPSRWQDQFSEFARALVSFRRDFAANPHDDAADAITGVVEREYGQSGRKISAIAFGS